MTETISVRVRAFAGLREALGASDFAVALPQGADIAGLVAKLAADYPQARLPARRFTVAVNRAYAAPDRVLADGDEVALIPPVGGGSGDVGARSPRPLFEIVTSPISLDEVAARVAAADRGGITVFAGTVRGVTGEVSTDYLEYEAYPEMAEAMLAQIGDEILTRWPSVAAVSIVHRIGRLKVGETSIAIAVAAAHRQDTFDACHYAIDRVKQIAPIWKREVGSDGIAWVEGPA
ncbi:MAG: molybdenum cofactor biosynthesis protein MoaE [Chloroflexi bacterium]|nr:molybdenum cofactor biosynthesis protein MoaE [Chloroflexota bacterium]